MTLDTSRYDKLPLPLKALVDSFKEDCCGLRAIAIDPDSERDWYDLSIGYFLAKGLSIDQVTDLALIVRYDLQYWC